MTMKRILLVEDDLQFNAFVKQALESDESNDFQVTSVLDGAEAASIIKAEPAFDLLITDLLLPEKDGIRLIIETKAAQPNLQIIAMSGGVSEHSHGFLQAAAALGASSILEKPFTSEQLIKAVEEYLG